VHRHPDTEFVAGDAEHLPAETSSFDAVINVESSHCYGDIAAFYREVARVLRPGGRFLYTDLIPHDRVEDYERALAGLGLALEDRRDITSNVVLSCDETAATHARAFHTGNDRSILEAFLGVPSSRLYDAMKNGQQRYLLYHFQKSA
jgi:SAM-dependent methyltransferase